MCDVLFRGGGKIKLDAFFPARKAADERWEVVFAPSRRILTLDECGRYVGNTDWPHFYPSLLFFSNEK